MGKIFLSGILSALCNYCILCIDTIEHHFYYCVVSQDFSLKVSDWLNSFMRESFSFSICEMLLGITKTSTTDTHYYTHNYVTILGKRFINLKTIIKQGFSVQIILNMSKIKLEF